VELKRHLIEMEPMTLSNDDGMSVILPVEDEFFISEYLRLLLEQAGYEVVPTHNADEAIAVLEGRSDIHTIICRVLWMA
jgi:CheY-like chemotaxis protein